MSDQRISLAYNLCHPPADPGSIKTLIEMLRLKAIDLGFLRVGDLIWLNGDAEIIDHEYGERFLFNELPITPIIPTNVCYFEGWLFDSEFPVEIGLCRFPLQIEVDGVVIPFGVPDWMWTAATRISDLKSLSLLLHHAAEIGIWAAVSFASGRTMVYSRDEAGVVKVETEQDDVPDDC